LLTFIAVLLLLPLFIHWGFKLPKKLEKTDPSSLGLTFETVSIPTVSNKHLFGWRIPGAKSNTTIIMIHGWGSNAEEMMPLALPFHNAKINLLLIDSRNHGQSDRDNHSSLPRFAEDLGMSIEWLKKNHPKTSQKIVLLGHSVGAGAVLFTASKRQDVDAVISISAFAHPKWMMQRFFKTVHIPSLLISPILHYIEWLIGHRYEDIAPINTINLINCPILLIHGKADKTVPIEDALAIKEGCKSTHVKFLIVEDADHDSIEKIKEHEEELVGFVREALS